MNELQTIRSKTMESMLADIGFEKVRQKGNHVFYRRWDDRYTTVPIYPERLLVKSLVREISKDIRIKFNVDAKEYEDFKRMKF